jgi:hypothetical protein
MSDEPQCDLAELKRLWKMSYQDLVEAPGQPSGRLREARIVMQAKVAMETRRLGVIMALATIAMTIATFVMAVNSFLN